MNYVEARSLIEDGDQIAVCGVTGILTPSTKFFTRSKYTHSGIAYWLDGGLWMVEINGGANHAVPLSQYAGLDFDVYYKPEEAVNIRTAIATALRVKIHYGFASLPIIGLLNWLRIRMFIHARNILSCAGFSMFIYELAGYPEHTRILSPVDLTRLLKLRLSVQGDAKLVVSPT